MRIVTSGISEKGDKVSIWKSLEKNIICFLSKFSSDDIVFKNAHQAIEGFPPQGPRSDGMLSNDNALLAVEIEAGPMNPDTNVTKN